MKAPKISETAEHRVIASYFKKIGLGGNAIAIHIRNERGSAWERMIAGKMGILRKVPDWLIIDAGRSHFFELKERGFKEKLARGVGITKHVAEQLECHNRLRLAGASVVIVETLEELLHELRKRGVPLRSESLSTERIRRGIENAMKEAAE